MPSGGSGSPLSQLRAHQLRQKLRDPKATPRCAIVLLTSWCWETMRIVHRLNWRRQFLRVRMANSFHGFWGLDEVCLLEASLTQSRGPLPLTLINQNKVLGPKSPPFLPFDNILKSYWRVREFSGKFPQLDALLLVN